MLAVKQPLNVTTSGDTDSFLHLKRVAWLSVALQYWAAVIYLFCSLLTPESNDAAVGCGVLAILIATTPVLYALFSKQFLVLFSCISAFNIAPIWFLYLEAILPGYDAYMHIDPALRMETLFWIAVFLIFTNIIYAVSWQSVSHLSIRTFSFLNAINLDSSFYRKATLICFVLPLIGKYFVYRSFDIMWMAMTAGRAGEDLVRETTNAVNGVLVPIDAVWQLTPLLGVIAFVSSKKKGQLLTIFPLVLGLIVIFTHFLSGSRGIMMFVAAPFLLFLLYYNWDRGLKFWVTVTAILFVLIGIMELQVRFRGNLLDVIADPARAAQERGYTSATTFDPTESHRDNNMYLLCLMVQGYPERYPFEGFDVFFTVLLNPIPRAIWPGKPVLIGEKDLSQQSLFVLDGPVYMGTTSLSYSVVGDAYLAGGVIGLFVYGLFYGIFLLFFDGITCYTNRSKPISVGVLGLGVFLAFWGFRALFALISFSYPIIVLILVFKLIQIFRPNANYVYSA